jgi:transmembrane sensor
MKHDDLNDPRACAAYWFTRLHSGEATEDEQRAFERWRQADPEHDRHYRNLLYFWDATLSIPEERLRATLNKTDEPPRQPRYTRRQFGLGLAAACSALVVAGVLGSPWWDAPEHVIELVTARGERRAVTLPDETVLYLNTATRATAKLYANRRTLELESGEVLFQVKSDQERPFIVDAGLSKIVVTGTRFDVRRDTHAVQVSVESGSVNVTTGAWWNRVTRRLTAGQTVATNSDQGIGQVASIDVANVTAWQRGKIVFDDAPLSLVIAEMNRYLPQAAILDAPSLAQHRIAGVFSIDDPQAMMDALPAIAPVRVVHLPDGRLHIVAR